MNILPKKRWHVRNKDNIARVRKDEAKAQEEKNEREYRQKLAEREARTNLLREKAKLRVGCKDFIPLVKKDVGESSGHINFFQEIEDSREESNRTNKEHEQEKRDEREKYEKQIGYLTYLGQDTNEASGRKNWYEEIPVRESEEVGEVNLKSKLKDDPLEIIQKYMPSKHFQKMSCKSNIEIFTRKEGSRYSSINNKIQKKKNKMKHKHKSNKIRSVTEHSASEKRKKLEALRMERLHREKEERQKTDLLLAQLNNKKSDGLSNKGNLFPRKYNSQFNPELARQNF